MRCLSRPIRPAYSHNFIHDPHSFWTPTYKGQQNHDKCQIATMNHNMTHPMDQMKITVHQTTQTQNMKKKTPTIPENKDY